MTPLLDDMAASLKLDDLIRRAAHAPKGEKKKRDKEKSDFLHRLLRQDVRAARRRRRA